MVNLDLFVIEDAKDAIIAAQSDIFDFIIDGTECENCGMMLGPLGEDFVSCVVVHSGGQDSWPICIDCATPMLFPNEFGISIEFIPDEEDD
jgi:hypothetical protein